jgi:hypothetical protein
LVARWVFAGSTAAARRWQSLVLLFSGFGFLGAGAISRVRAINSSLIAKRRLTSLRSAVFCEFGLIKSLLFFEKFDSVLSPINDSLERALPQIVKERQHPVGSPIVELVDPTQEFSGKPLPRSVDADAVLGREAFHWLSGRVPPN